MKMVFISNYYNHHQKELCENLNNELDGSFLFIETGKMTEERIKLGWSAERNTSFVETYSQSHSKIIEAAEIVIWGDAPFYTVKKRLFNNKLTFRYSERIFKEKPGIFRFYAHLFRAYYRYERFSNLYLLCASAFASFDYQKLHCFKGKAYKWGYFPEFIETNSIVSTTKSKIEIIWVGRLISWKHPEMMINIANRLIKKMDNFHISIVGIGDLYSSMQEHIKNDNLQEHVTLYGSLSPYDVRRKMCQADIFVSTSDQNEGWGAVVNEAMNSRCAVVVSDMVGSAPYLISDGNNGCLFNNLDENDLYTKLFDLITDDTKREKYANNAYNSIEKCWNGRVASQRLIELSAKLLAGEDTPFKEGPCSKA